MKGRSVFRALALAGTAAALFGGPAQMGCSSPFDPPSLVNTLRILDVAIDHPYAHPGDTVTFKMTYIDGRPDDSNTPVTIVWLGGCFNPEGQQYYACYEPLGELFQSLGNGEIPPDGLFAAGPGVDTFELPIPEDIISSQPDPSFGPKYGLAFVFYLACAGIVQPVDQQGDTAAGAFPLGCFDLDGNELGPDGFIPGYTQVYVFDDGRDNQNPPVNGLMFGDVLQAPDATLSANTCPVTLEERRKSGCSATDEFVECDVYDVDVDVPEDVAENDQEATDAEGNPEKEVVWVSYSATGGSFAGETKLISDATTGIQTDRAAQWVAPEEPGTYQIWAVVRDNRGGSHVVTHFVEVSEPE